MKWHAGAIACFLLALACYFLANVPGALGLAAIGVAFEILAWLLLWIGPDEDDPPRRPPG
jgi:hypothetical protein